MESLARIEALRLSGEDQRKIAAALLKPLTPSPALRRAFRHRGKLLRRT